MKHFPLVLLFATILISLSAIAADPKPIATSRPAANTSRPPAQFGVSLCGAEFGEGNLPGIFGKHYTYPTATELDYYKSKNVLLIRLPFRWERLQLELHGPLDKTELKRLDDFISLCKDRQMQVILDPHNYARYYGKLIGSQDVPNTAFTDFWAKVAEHYKDEKTIYAFSLVNEPHDTKSLWPAAAQAGVDGVRAKDMQHIIMVCGDNWASAKDWRKRNENLHVNDPADHVIYECHVYFDPDNKGEYKETYDAAKAHPQLGVERISDFVSWCDDHHVAGYVGEYGIPHNDPRWLPVLDNMLTYLQKNEIGGCYWAGGPWWKDYILTCEPKDGKDRPQMEVLMKYGGSRAGTKQRSDAK